MNSPTVQSACAYLISIYSTVCLLSVFFCLVLSSFVPVSSGTIASLVLNYYIILYYIIDIHFLPTPKYVKIMAMEEHNFRVC